ncbi:MAG: hypothetical protein RDV41_08260 [Planctomycetota bacterium]|nr:hypothetical protein [Planctomycetota bacterium]
MNTMRDVITITCPLCKGVLEIDISRRQVVRHWEHTEKTKDADLFAKAVERSKTRQDNTEKTYDSAKEKLRGPKRDIDELLKGRGK